MGAVGKLARLALRWPGVGAQRFSAAMREGLPSVAAGTLSRRPAAAARLSSSGAAQRPLKEARPPMRQIPVPAHPSRSRSSRLPWLLVLLTAGGAYLYLRPGARQALLAAVRRLRRGGAAAQPATEQPATGQPATAQSTMNQAATEPPAPAQPAVSQPAAAPQPAANRPGADQPEPAQPAAPAGVPAPAAPPEAGPEAAPPVQDPAQALVNDFLKAVDHATEHAKDAAEGGPERDPAQ